MKKQVYRVSSFFLAMALCVSLLTISAPASAAYVYKPEPAGWNVLRTGFFNLFVGFTGLDLDSWMNQQFLSRTGKLNTIEELQVVAADYNSAYGQWARGSMGGDWFSAIGNNAVVKKDEKNEIFRLWLERTETWVVNTRGEFPYVEVAGDVPDTPGTAPAEVPDFSPTGTNKWVHYNEFPPKGVSLSMSSKDSLTQTIIGLKDRGFDCYLWTAGNHYVIARTVGMRTEFWCDKQGRPFAASATPAAADNNFNYIVNDNSTTDNSQTVVDNKVIDTSNNTMTVINENGDKVTLNIDSLYWDDSTHSYTANTYNIVNNTYNYYTYNITYNITNTYINYIGSNAAYEQDEYKYYYELPDGRSSEDLTAEEVAGMSFQFADVTNYARSATDTSLRALYHFDGNTEDSGYFSTQTKFTWEAGASITYMDSASFNGALYLDELAHNFDIDLPSNLPSSSDFSVQWRHYQASQPDTLSNINNSLYIGGSLIMKWDERSFYWNGSSTATASVPIGSWHELALIRNNGILYFYINGVRVASMVDTTGYQGKLMFNFGANVRAYSMIDELRVVNFAVAKAGASYQCATVPYDTNLVLVLPDSVFPVADEYWDFKNPSARLSFDMTQGAAPAGISKGSSESVSFMSYNSGFTTVQNSAYRGSFTTTGGFDLRSYGLSYTSNSFRTSTTASTYYLSVIDSKGQIYSTSFTSIYYSGHYTVTVLSGVVGIFPWGALLCSGDGAVFRCGVIPRPGVSFDLVYMEISTKPITKDQFEFVSCIYSSEDIKPNTAAVQSSIPVNGYTVGGVRPTFPVRGDVWFPVEGRRITGCYIYDGSMWRTAGCRYYTGTRWIPIYAFDIYTLADCWDVADGGDVDPTPPITSESGFWNWFKKEWNDFRKWGNTSVSAIIAAIVAGGGAPTEECTKHEYRYKDITSATCTAKGSQLFTCTKCGDTYTEDTDHLGHDWLQIDDIQDTTDESGNTVKGYALWECSRCKLQHKDYDRTGPPPAEGDSTITELITNLFDKLGGLVGSVVDWLLELGTEAVDGLGDIGDYFKEKAGEVGGFGGEFLLLLSAFFAIIPPELMTCMSLAIVFLVLGLFVKKVLLK